MAEDRLDYNILIKNALRTVIRAALAQAARHDLTARHYFYITFLTGYDGVELAAYLRANHPHEMTIALQHQFRDLQVDEAGFRVTLNFNKIPQTLYVPFDAITSFKDPPAHFGLQFADTPLEVAPETIAPSNRSGGTGHVADLAKARRENRALRDKNTHQSHVKNIKNQTTPFTPGTDDAKPESAPTTDSAPATTPGKRKGAHGNQENPKKKQNRGEVISLDVFRKPGKTG